MCGRIVIFGRDVWIDCQIRREWWYDPGPLIDFRRLKFRVEEVTGPSPDPWKVDLTKIVQILEALGHFESDGEFASRIGEAVADAGNEIARRAEVDIQFSWESHN